MKKMLAKLGLLKGVLATLLFLCQAGCKGNR